LNESRASSGDTQEDSWSVLMNSRTNSKSMLIEVKPFKFASYDVKCFVFDRVIPASSTDEKYLGSEEIRFPYHKPTPVDR
jgi:hypothetical protein